MYSSRPSLLCIPPSTYRRPPAGCILEIEPAEWFESSRCPLAVDASPLNMMTMPVESRHCVLPAKTWSSIGDGMRENCEVVRIHSYCGILDSRKAILSLPSTAFAIPIPGSQLSARFRSRRHPRRMQRSNGARHFSEGKCGHATRYLYCHLMVLFGWSRTLEHQASEASISSLKL